MTDADVCDFDSDGQGAGILRDVMMLDGDRRVAIIASGLSARGIADCLEGIAVDCRDQATVDLRLTPANLRRVARMIWPPYASFRRAPVRDRYLLGIARGLFFGTAGMAAILLLWGAS